ncbi:MFS transporter [Photorhabdus sp. RM71S]|uniref:MFS transporter n=1 Tax=Photorhabdus sp. RM71S TaxID=3342824 RepID=UPI0036DD6360
MRTMSALFLLFGTLFTAGGYGATFLISAYFRSQGGSDIDTGTTLSVALIGTLIGVPLVGWFAGQLEASRLAALAALAMSCGYFLLGGFSGELGYIPRIAAFLIGLGWGMFYISGPMALSERVTDVDRGHWFTRFSAFQMAGICGSPILLAAAVEQAGVPIRVTFLFVGVIGILASLLLATFGVREPHGQRELSLRPWVRKITKIAASSAIRPIVMVGLGGGVFSGMMSFQSSLVEGTQANASTFFAVHAATVVVSRLLLARRLSTMPRIPLVIALMLFLVMGILALLGIPVHPLFQIVAAMLTGIGYGLVYPVIQTWAVNDSALENRHAALTWFVVAYFVGIFGFPAIGGWILVGAGKTLFILTLAAIASLELVVALLGGRWFYRIKDRLTAQNEAR